VSIRERPDDISTDTWHDKNVKLFQPGVHYLVRIATKIYAVLSRLRWGDFVEVMHYDGISPP
jgi:hypothetical protein